MTNSQFCSIDELNIDECLGLSKRLRITILTAAISSRKQVRKIDALIQQRFDKFNIDEPKKSSNFPFVNISCRTVTLRPGNCSMMESLLRVLGGSIMIRVLLAVVTVLVVYAMGKVVAHFWTMHRAFRGIPCHPKKHWLYGHAYLVCCTVSTWD